MASFFRIAKYDIEVTTPYGNKPTQDEDKLRPEKFPILLVQINIDTMVLM